MEAQRMTQLLLLWCRIRSTRVALRGGNHTATSEIDLEIQSDLDGESSIWDDKFDFVLTLNSNAAKSADGVLKLGGLLAIQFHGGRDEEDKFDEQIGKFSKKAATKAPFGDNGGSSGGVQWLFQSYPTRNQYFESYNLEIEGYDVEMPGMSGYRIG
ncbi:hypothetical protein Acr_00g0037890 [Actinidia rufa]|uniref:Uncharacterized protein n=1 Tax=Actinidia rufa TaxID=165716 RepID=A0A7J0DH14_9ERIC|nr:hypothetical protein Acr_00g0037890 [Actinidia rufa]